MQLFVSCVLQLLQVKVSHPAIGQPSNQPVDGVQNIVKEMIDHEHDNTMALGVELLGGDLYSFL